jgi:hypothetical protein
MPEEKTQTIAQFANKQQNNELVIDDFSEKSLNERKTYERPNLHDKQDVIKKFQVFAPDTTKDPKLTQTSKMKFYPVTVLITYESSNSDGVQNREYISGARCFVQSNGNLSEVNFYYDGADTQVANLWRLVAETKGKKPEDMSPREFIAFLNNSPKVLLEGKTFKNFGAKSGEPSHIVKNLPTKFL